VRTRFNKVNNHFISQDEEEADYYVDPVEEAVGIKHWRAHNRHITSLFARSAANNKGVTSHTVVTNTTLDQLMANTESSVHSTVSNLTDQTTETIKSAKHEETNKTTEAMEEEEEEAEEEDEDNGLEPESLTATPKTIPIFQPNSQWLKDIQEGNPRKKYGIKFKIEPQKDTAGERITPDYNHVRIFKALVSGILSAAPTTVICSINDEAAAFDNIDDINFSKGTVERYLEHRLSIQKPTHITLEFTFSALSHYLYY
jgi:hypothetical protein